MPTVDIDPTPSETVRYDIDGVLRLGGTLNHTEVSSDGHMALRGESVYWDDLRFPAGGVNPPGPENAPTVDPDTGLYVFADGSTRILAGLAQLPHVWREASALGPHIHWIQTAPGNVLWRFETRVFDAVDDDFPEEWTTTYASTTTHAYPGTGSRVMITPLPAPDVTGRKVSAMVLFRISRMGGDVLDTLSANVRLLEFDIHHQIDSQGSRTEYVK